MSVGAILGSVLQSALAAANSPSKFKQFQQEFQQLGKDLQSGNLGQAQSDLEQLEHNSPFLCAGTAASTSSATGASVGASSNPIAQAFSQLERDLKAGNVAAAQQDFSTIQQTFHQNAQRAYSTLQQNLQQSANSSGSGIRSVNTTA
jgi:outer membrane protein assembly factor BamD (BamD/ComL family)